jgi:hypothetical protein
MGLGPTAINLFSLLESQGMLKGQQQVADFGSQEFQTSVDGYSTLLERLCEKFGAKTPAAELLSESHLKGPTQDLYRQWGWDVQSFDIDGRFGSVITDFNFDSIAETLHGKFSITTNLGTSEHIFNQANFFKLQHELTAVDGLMLHTVPLSHYVNHGLFSYSPVLFYSLAHFNQYEVLGIWKNSKPNLHEFIPAEVPFDGPRAFLVVVLKKLVNTPFRMPIQVNEPMVMAAEAEARYSATQTVDLAKLANQQRLPRSFWVDLKTAEISTTPIDKAPTKDEKRLAREAHLEAAVKKLKDRLSSLSN